MSQQEQIKEMVERNFARYDHNGDGFLELDEFLTLINETFKEMGHSATVGRREAEKMMGRFDFDKNNLVSKSELYSAYKKFFGLK